MRKNVFPCGSLVHAHWNCPQKKDQKVLLGQDKLVNENKIRLIYEQDIVKPKLLQKTSKNYKTNLKSEKPLKNNKKIKKLKKQVAIDTCSGINLTPDIELIRDYVPLETTPSFYGVGEGNKINILGAGFLNVKISPKETARTAVFYTPNEDATILSALALNKDTGLQIDANFRFVYGVCRQFILQFRMQTSVYSLVDTSIG